MTGWIDTNYKGKVEYTIEFLKSKGDFVLLHIEAIDECGHVGDLEKKIQAIRQFDSEVVAPLRAGLESLDAFRLLITSDHLTYLSRKTHVSGPVPFIAYDSDRSRSNRKVKMGERAAAETGVRIQPGHSLLPGFLDGRLFDAH
jgi:2,3-bisphosphoglycerate-independent phosphoglycerate mutase